MISTKSWNINAVILYRLFIVFILHTLCRIVFLMFNFHSFQPYTTEGIIKLFVGGLKFDAAGIMFLNMLIILLSIIPVQFRHQQGYQRVVYSLFVFFNLIGIALNIMDIGYYPFTKTRTTASVFAQFSEETNKLTLFSRFFIDYWHLLIIFVVFGIALVFTTIHIKVSTPQIKKRSKYILASSALIPLYILFVVYCIRGNMRAGAKPLYLNDAAAYTTTPSQVPLVLSTPFSVIRTIGKKSYEKRNYFDNEESMEKWINPVHTPDSTVVFTPKNVVILILESFGREYIGAVNSLPENQSFVSYTPFLDSLFQHGLVYKNAFANGRTSIEAPPAIFASIPSLSMPYTLSQNANNEMKSLVHCLKEKGYHSAFFHGADNGTMRFDAFTHLAGFDHYYGRTEYNNEKDFDGMWGIWDEEYLQYFANEMQAMPQPFITSVFTLTSHHPFPIPQKYTDRFPKGDLPIHQCIGYTDNALRQFFNTARQMPWYNNTLFVITADHASIPWHDEYKTLPGEFAIPLCFYAPGDKLKNYNTTTVASQIDIMPTVLGLLGYNSPFFAYGKNLINTPADKNYTITANKDRFQVYHNQLMMVKEGNQIMQWQDLSKGYTTSTEKFTPEIEEMDSLIFFGKAFEQEFFNRVIENRIRN